MGQDGLRRQPNLLHKPHSFQWGFAENVPSGLSNNTALPEHLVSQHLIRVCILSWILFKPSLTILLMLSVEQEHD